jgi:hypothetical protein
MLKQLRLLGMEAARVKWRRALRDKISIFGET